MADEPDPWHSLAKPADALQRWTDLESARSRDWSAVVDAGRALASDVETLRQQLTAAEGALEMHECSCPHDDDAPLADVVREWHDAEHADAWSVCPVPVCRAATVVDS